MRAMSTADPSPKGRSAFAAATFSALLPGLGQAYAGRWSRALLWVAPYILLGALLAGILVDPATRTQFAARFTAPSWLLGAIVAIAIDAVFRALAAIDAWRLAASGATRPTGASTRNGPALRTASIAGLAGVLLMLTVSHVAVARFPYLAYDALTSIGGGDQDPIIPLSSASPFASHLRTPVSTLAPSVPAPTPTASPTPGPSGSPTPFATPTSTIAPGEPWNGTDRLNILLIGADRREEGTTYLTDTMIVATIDPATKQIGMISLPRDTTGVPLPPSWAATSVYGSTYGGKINSLYTAARGRSDLFPGNDTQRGYVALKGALSELYQLDIQYYIAVDLTGFKTVIDTLGGVIIDVQTPVSDPRYATDDGRAAVKLYIPAGIQHMDGAEALSYARARHETSDFDRAERQQRVITSLRDQTDIGQLLEPGVLQRLLEAFKQEVKTDIPPELFPQLVTLGASVDLDARISLVLAEPTYSTVCYPCPGTGLYELQANVPAMREAVADIFTARPPAPSGSPGASRPPEPLPTLEPSP